MTVPFEGTGFVRALSAVLLLSVAQGVPAVHAGLSPALLAFVQTSPPTASWALGMVVPEGAALEGGGRVSWGSATNLSALVRLPLVNSTDNTILVVLSAMIGENSVVQIAAGLFPRTNSWKAVAWFVPDIGAEQQEYEWTLNSTQLSIQGGASVSLSIFRSGGGWQYGIADLGTNSGLTGPFANAADLPFRSGDQEVFALESYTSNATILSGMGNLTLTSVFLDGQRVVGGSYLLGSWDPNRNPLFVVGGLSAPYFISVKSFNNGTLVWGYSNEWGSIGVPASDMLLFLAVGLACFTAALLLVAARNVWRGRPPAPAGPRL